MAKKVYGVCRLCGLEKPLIEAHIIPEAFYKSLYNESGKIIEVRSDKDELRSIVRRKGLYDPGILCSSCDNGIINKCYDDYASKAFFGYRNLRASISDHFNESNPKVRWRIAEGINSQTIKLFFLSVLWRAHVSSLPMFSDVDLDPSHGEAIRRMIFNQDCGKISDYPIILMHYSILNKKAQGFISGIMKYKKEGSTYYAAAISGLCVIWYMSDNLIPESLKPFILGWKTDETRILHSLKQGDEFILNFLGDII